MAKTDRAADGAAALEAYRLVEAPGHLMRRAQQRAVELFQRAVGRKGPTPRQFAVMLTIAQQPGLKQTELVALTGIDRSTLAELIERLARQGWVNRRRTRTDQRANAVELTEAGVKVAAAALPAVRRAQAQILAPLPAERRPAFLAALALLADLPGRPRRGRSS